MMTLHAPVPPHAPNQLANREPLLGVAINDTLEREL